MVNKINKKKKTIKKRYKLKKRIKSRTNNRTKKKSYKKLTKRNKRIKRTKRNKRNKRTKRIYKNKLFGGSAKGEQRDQPSLEELFNYFGEATAESIRAAEEITTEQLMEMVNMTHEESKDYLNQIFGPSRSDIFMYLKHRVGAELTRDLSPEQTLSMVQLEILRYFMNYFHEIKIPKDYAIDFNRLFRIYKSSPFPTPYKKKGSVSYPDCREIIDPLDSFHLVWFSAAQCLYFDSLYDKMRDKFKLARKEHVEDLKKSPQKYPKSWTTIAEYATESSELFGIAEITELTERYDINNELLRLTKTLSPVTQGNLSRAFYGDTLLSTDERKKELKQKILHPPYELLRHWGRITVTNKDADEKEEEFLERVFKKIGVDKAKVTLGCNPQVSVSTSPREGKFKLFPRMYEQPMKREFIPELLGALRGDENRLECAGKYVVTPMQKPAIITAYHSSRKGVKYDHSFTVQGPPLYVYDSPQAISFTYIGHRTATEKRTNDVTTEGWEKKTKNVSRKQPSDGRNPPNELFTLEQISIGGYRVYDEIKLRVGDRLHINHITKRGGRIIGVYIPHPNCGLEKAIEFLSTHFSKKTDSVIQYMNTVFTQEELQLIRGQDQSRERIRQILSSWEIWRVEEQYSLIKGPISKLGPYSERGVRRYDERPCVILWDPQTGLEFERTDIFEFGKLLSEPEATFAEIETKFEEVRNTTMSLLDSERGNIEKQIQKLRDELDQLSPQAQVSKVKAKTGGAAGGAAGGADVGAADADRASFSYTSSSESEQELPLRQMKQIQEIIAQQKAKNEEVKLLDIREGDLSLYLNTEEIMIELIKSREGQERLFYHLFNILDLLDCKGGFTLPDADSPEFGDFSMDLGELVQGRGGDFDDMLRAVQQDGMALFLAEPVLEQNEEIVSAAVKQNGLALQFAHDSMKKNKAIVSSAVTQDIRALQYADEFLQYDKEIIEMVINEKQQLILQTWAKDGLWAGGEEAHKAYNPYHTEHDHQAKVSESAITTGKLMKVYKRTNKGFRLDEMPNSRLLLDFHQECYEKGIKMEEYDYFVRNLIYVSMGAILPPKFNLSIGNPLLQNHFAEHSPLEQVVFDKKPVRGFFTKEGLIWLKETHDSENMCKKRGQKDFFGNSICAPDFDVKHIFNFNLWEKYINGSKIYKQRMVAATKIQAVMRGRKARAAPPPPQRVASEEPEPAPSEEGQGGGARQIGGSEGYGEEELVGSGPPLKESDKLITIKVDQKLGINLSPIDFTVTFVKDGMLAHRSGVRVGMKLYSVEGEVIDMLDPKWSQETLYDILGSSIQPGKSQIHVQFISGHPPKSPKKESRDVRMKLKTTKFCDKMLDPFIIDEKENEYWLFHGTNFESVSKILQGNFSDPLNVAVGKQGRNLYGEYCYFTNQLCKALGYSTPFANGIELLLFQRKRHQTETSTQDFRNPPDADELHTEGKIQVSFYHNIHCPIGIDSLDEHGKPTKVLLNLADLYFYRIDIGLEEARALGVDDHLESTFPISSHKRDSHVIIDLQTFLLKYNPRYISECEADETRTDFFTISHRRPNTPHTRELPIPMTLDRGSVYIVTSKNITDVESDPLFVSCFVVETEYNEMDVAAYIRVNHVWPILMSRVRMGSNPFTTWVTRYGMDGFESMQALTGDGKKENPEEAATSIFAQGSEDKRNRLSGSPITDKTTPTQEKKTVQELLETGQIKFPKRVAQKWWNPIEDMEKYCKEKNYGDNCLLFDSARAGVEKGHGVVFYEQQDKEDLGDNPEKFKVHMVNEDDPNFQQHNEFMVSRCDENVYPEYLLLLKYLSNEEYDTLNHSPVRNVPPLLHPVFTIFKPCEQLKRVEEIYKKFLKSGEF